LEAVKYKIKRYVPVLLAMSFFIATTNCSTGVTPYPILVLATDSHFGSFTAEILRTEGFNEFEIHPLADTKVTLPYLKKFDVVILTENAVTETQQEMLVRYVKEGGNLIAFKPDKRLSDVFGIANTGGTLSDAYILTDTNTEIGKGIASQTLQFHGEADKVSLKGGKSIAALYKDAITPTE